MRRVDGPAERLLRTAAEVRFGHGRVCGGTLCPPPSRLRCRQGTYLCNGYVHIVTRRIRWRHTVRGGGGWTVIIMLSYSGDLGDGLISGHRKRSDNNMIIIIIITR